MKTLKKKKNGTINSKTRPLIVNGHPVKHNTP
eukprot:CAMPEP_0170873218 /NCGR_PEP_ID=MMETSP0734-20130129/27220_1 /TAXON_ID=186038 /ORGANISM="Fragilariopsis kerguelensis, Strain L26-C5" /LENGTH=31 /DNA_ID= /DNA_START= /DNA_END= /DNA_ORIENTATION=